MVMTQPMAGNAPGAEPLDKKAAKAAKKAAKAAEKGSGKGKGKKKSKKKLIIGAVLLLVVVKFVVLKPKAAALNCPEGMAWAQKYVGQPEEHAAPAAAAAPAEAAGHGEAAAPEGEGGGKSAEKPKPDPCAPVAGAVYNAEEAVTLNLADGRFAKFKIALQLTSKASLEEFTADEKGAKGKHVAINVLGTKSYQDMQPPRLLEVEKELAQAIAAVYEGEVMNVYFIDLVKQ